MTVELELRSIPFTRNRALTEVVRSRHLLDEARRSLELALEIFQRLDEPISVPMARLGDVLAQIEEAEATLWEAAQ